MTDIALNAPVRSMEMLELQVAAKATEIYVGLATEELTHFTFNGRAKSMDDFPCQVASVRMLRNIVNEAHDAGLRVHFSANAPYVPEALRAAYLAQVHAAIDAGCDGVIVGNVGLAHLLRERGVALPLTAGLLMNVGTVRFARYLLQELNIRRIVVPHATKLAEISALAEIPELVVEVPVHTGAGNSCGRCMLFDSAARPELGMGCRASYSVEGPVGTRNDEVAVMDAAGDCSLCSVGDLIRAGARAFKIPGRESPNLRVNAKLTQLYRKLIDDSLADKAVARSIEEIDRVELMWQMRWVPRFCNEQRCKFRETPITNSYV